MDWNVYWTLIWQVAIACAILAFPVSIVGFFVSSAISSGRVKRTVAPEEPTGTRLI